MKDDPATEQYLRDHANDAASSEIFAAATQPDAERTRRYQEAFADRAADAVAANEDALFGAFVAGFMTAIEGWNGEYPYDFTAVEVASKPELRKFFGEWRQTGRMRDH